MNKYKKLFFLLGIFVLVPIFSYVLFFHNKNIKQLSILELDKKNRWTLESYERYKLDTNAVNNIMRKEMEYAEKVEIVETVNLAKQSSLTRDEITPAIKESLKKLGMSEGDIVVSEQNTPDRFIPDKQGESVLGTSSNLATPQIGTRDVPSIAGGNVNKYTGTVSYSYSIQIPPVRGNAGVGVGLNYSSRFIDDLRTNKVGYADVHPDFYNGRKCEGDYCYEYWDELIGAHTDSTTGLGWSLSSFGSITLDTDYYNEFVLSVGGQNVRIKEENGRFFTYPANKFVIERYGKWGAWKVTDTSGNVYFFGSIDDEKNSGNSNIPRNSANEYMADGMYGSEGSPFCWNDKVARWNLSRISDIHGNTVEIEYSQKIEKVIAGCDQSMLTTPIEVKYNFSEEEGKYINRVVLGYMDYDTKQVWDTNTNSLESLLLNKVIVYGGDHIINEYHFGYTKSFMNSKWVGGQTRRLLLTSIAKKGFDGKGEQRPTTFCYKSLKDGNNPKVCNGTDTSQTKDNYTPNDIYLTSFDNGYGGKVRYSYEKVANIDKICTSVKHENPERYTKECGNSPSIGGNNYLASFYRVANVEADNGLGQKKKTEYRYIGQSLAFISEHKRWGGIPGTGIGIAALQGVQFLGYPQVQIKVSDSSDPNKVLSHVRASTYQFNENDSCVMIDPRYGVDYKSEILDTNANVIGFTDNSVIVRQGSNCIGDPKKWGEKEVYSKEVFSQLDGKKTKQENFYDFEIYGDTPDQSGNVVKSINYGNPDTSGDEVYSYNRYFNKSVADDQIQNGLIPATNTFDKYKAKNLINLAYQSWISDTNYNKPEDVPNNKKLNWSGIIYDQRLDQWGTQEGISGVRGLPSTNTQAYYGVSIDEPDKLNVLNSLMDYNKYGLSYKATDPTGVVAVTFYDNYLHSIPLCSVVINKDSSSLASNDLDNLCDVTKDKGKKMVQKLSFDNREKVLKQLPDYSEDANGARTSYRFDEYGRVTEVYTPDPNTPFKTLDFPAQQAFYYDSLSPMRTRIQVATYLPDNTKITKTSDSFMDGFGNPSQTIAYNNFDKDGEFASVSYQQFNGIGQVTNKITNIPVRNLKPTDTPQLVSDATLNQTKALASREQTTYDYFSRPVEVKVTLGGESGAPVTKTIKTSYNGYNVLATDAVGNQVKRFIDGLGREVKTVNYLCAEDSNCGESNGKAIEVNTKFNILGNPIEIKDSKGYILKTATYNSASMPLQIIDADRGVSKIYYDNYGQVAKAVDAKGVSVENSYDGFGRVIKSTIKSAAGKVERESANEYDTDKIGVLYKTELKGQITGNINAFIQTAVTKSNYLGSPTEIRTTTVDAGEIDKGRGMKYITKIDSNSYTNTGLLTNFKSKLEGASDYLDNINYDYKEDLKLKNVKDNTTGKLLVDNIVNDYKGQILSYKLGALDISQSFDNQSRLLAKETKAGTTLIDKLLYQYNQASNIVKFDSNNSEETKTYTYDSFSRLKSVAGQYDGEYRISDVGALNYKKEGANLSENTFVSDLISNNSNPCADSNYINITKYNAGVNSCPYHGVLYSTVNGKKVTYLYDKNGNLVKEVFDNRGFRMYKYGVLDLPLEIVDYDQNSKQINLTRFIYGLGGQRIGKIGRTVENFNWDLNGDGVVDDKDAQALVNLLFDTNSKLGNNYSITGLTQLLNEWKQ